MAALTQDLRFDAAGLKARYLQGGIDGWMAAGRPLVDMHEGAAL
jgi:Fe-Mn family superoxide dismutase